MNSFGTIIFENDLKKQPILISQRFDGTVDEIESEAHMRNFMPGAMQQAFDNYKNNIKAISVPIGPGLPKQLQIGIDLA